MKKLYLSLIFLAFAISSPFAQTTRSGQNALNDSDFFACGNGCISGSVLQNYNTGLNASIGFLFDTNAWTGANSFSIAPTVPTGTTGESTSNAASEAFVVNTIGRIGTGVTSVGMTAPSFLTVTGSPVTTIGTLGLSLTSQTANTFLSGPSNGSATTPTFRTLTPNDLPAAALQYITPQKYGASFSVQNTTGTASSLSTSLTLASSIDFANGNGIRINHAGASFSLASPTGLTITQGGTGGSTSYQYTIASLDTSGGVGATITPVSTTTGNATLNSTNYNHLTWTAASGVTFYLVCGNKSGTLVPIAVTATNSYSDYGVETWTPPDFLPAVCPISSSLPDWLVTTIASGGGTPTLTLTNATINAIINQYVIHDDTVADQAWLTAAVTNHYIAFAPCGDSPISSTLTASTSITLIGCGYQADSGKMSSANGGATGQGYAYMTLANLTGSGSVFVATPNISGMIFTGNDPVNLQNFEILYPVGNFGWDGATAWPTTVGLTVQSTGGYTGSQNSNGSSLISSVDIFGADTGEVLTNVENFELINPQLLLGWEYGLIINGYNYPGAGDSVILGGQIAGCCNNTGLFGENYQAGILNNSGAGLKITGTKFNFGNGTTTNWILESPFSYYSTSQTGNTHTTTTIDGIGNTSGWIPGMKVICSVCQASTTITTINSSSSITVSLATTGTSSGVALTVESIMELEPLLIDGVSIEGGAICVTMIQPVVGVTGQIGLFSITGSELWCGLNTIYINGSSSYIGGLVISGNNMQIESSVGQSVVAIDDVTGGVFTGNYLGCFGGCSSGIGWTLGSHSSRINVQSNAYDPGITTTVNDVGTNNTKGATSGATN